MVYEKYYQFDVYYQIPKLGNNLFDFDYIDKKKANLTIDSNNLTKKWGIYNKNIYGNYDYLRGSYSKVTDRALDDIWYYITGIGRLDKDSNFYFMIDDK